MVRTFAAQVFKAQAAAPQVALRQAGQAVGLVHFKHIALQHGVVHIALRLDAVVGKHMAVVFDVLAQLGVQRAFQPGFEHRQHVFTWQLLRRAGVAVRQRNIGRLARHHAQADAHNLGAHFVQGRGLGVHGHQVGGLHPREPALQRVQGAHRLVVRGAQRGLVIKQRGLAGRVWAGFAGCRRPVALGRRAVRKQVRLARGADARRLLGHFRCRRTRQAFKAHALVKIVQGRSLLRACDQLVQGGQAGQPVAQVAIGLDGEQLPPGGQPVQRFAQVFAHHAFDVAGVGHHRLQAAVFLQPLHGGFGADFGHAGHVVHGVAHQGLVVQHQVRGHTKFFLHAGQVAPLAVHGVDDGDALVDQLRQIFVAAADHHVHAPPGGQHRQGTNHVVRFHARHVEHAHAQKVHHLVDGRNLQAQIVRHGRALGFVFGVNRVAKGGAFGVKHAGHIGRRHLFL